MTPAAIAGGHAKCTMNFDEVVDEIVKEELVLSWSSRRLPDWLQFLMYGKTKEQWLELCEQAANEQDTAKLKALIEDIARLLKEKEDRLKTKPPGIGDQPVI